MVFRDFVIDGSISGPTIDNTKLLLALWLVADGRRIRYTKEVKNIMINKKELQTFCDEHNIKDKGKIIEFLRGINHEVGIDQ